MASFVDRAIALRPATLQYQHGLVGPSACLLEGLVSRWIYKDIVEHGVRGRCSLRVVTHVDARG